MEDPASFDLNTAIRQWRRGFENAPALRGQDLDELESHLRDSAQMLTARGLDAGEAFLVATHRLGGNQELEAEFAKVNGSDVWFERSLWMVCGLMVANLLWPIGAVPSNMVMNLGLWHGVNAHVVAGLSLLTKWLVWVGFIAGGFLVLPRLSRPLTCLALVALKRPVWAGIVLVLALEGFQLVPRHVMRLLEPLWQTIANPARKFSPESQAVIQTWLIWGWRVTQLAWIVSVPLFAGYVWRKMQPHRLSGWADPVGNLDPAEQENFRDLQERKGLSVQEAVLVLRSRRRGTATSPGGEEASFRGLWLRRAFWMLVGVVIFQSVLPLIFEPSTILIAVSNGASPLVQNLAGFGAICLCLGLLAGISLLVARGVVKYRRQVIWLARLCGERPVLAAVLLLGLCFGIGAAFETAARMLPGFGISGIGSLWLQYGSMVIQLALPVVLLLWLARHQADIHGVV